MPSAFAEMEALGHQWVGEEHVLLASLSETGDLRARLAELGLTYQRARDAAAPRVPRATGDDWRSSNPSYHTAKGRAEGLALALGAPRPRAVHNFVAALWERNGPASALLAALDVDRDGAIAATELRLSHPTNPLHAAGERQAAALGDGYVGDWHVLLAFLAGQPDPLAGKALEGCGLTHADCAAWLASRDFFPPARPNPHAPSGALRPNPRCRQLFGRAEGLAAVEGATSARSEHGLVAYLWEPDASDVLLIEAWGTTEPAVAHALADLGARLPSTPRPERDRTPWGEPVSVPYERLMEAVDRLHAANLPVGSWGFNHYEGRAWVSGHAHLDLRAILGPLALPSNGPSLS